MDKEDFEEFLASEYEGTLGSKSIGDTVSRCRRVEKELDVDLDCTDPLSLMERVEQISPSTGVQKNLRNALLRYSEFKEARCSSKHSS